MAKIAFSALVADARGSVGNVTFTKSRQGATARVRVSGGNPQTTDQTLVRDNMTNSSRAWSSTLTQAQRDVWSNAGGLIPVVNPVNGQTSYMTGYNYYVMLSHNFVRMNAVGTTRPTAPPATAFVPPTTTASVTSVTTATGVIVGTFSAAVAATVPVEILYQPLANRGRKISADKWKSMGFVSDAVTPFDWTRTLKITDRNRPAYAIGYRFANQVSGQVGTIVNLGIFIPV